VTPDGLGPMSLPLTPSRKRRLRCGIVHRTIVQKDFSLGDVACRHCGSYNIEI
jgi:hypothetical protein